MNPKQNTTGIILSGGKSSRMKTEKGLVKIHGRELIQYVIDNLSPLCNEILISSNSPGYAKFGYNVIKDEIRDIGPVGGIYTCLRASSNKINILISCDLPFAETKTLEYLLNQYEGHPVTVPWYKEDHYEPLCAIYTKDFLPILEKAIENGNYKLPRIFASTDIKKVVVSGHPDYFMGDTFFNVNTMEDVGRLERISRKEP